MLAKKRPKMCFLMEFLAQKPKLRVFDHFFARNQLQITEF